VRSPQSALPCRNREIALEQAEAQPVGADMSIDLATAPPLSLPALDVPAPRKTDARPTLESFAVASLVFSVIELAAAWGWLHWQADRFPLAPSILVVAAMRSAFFLLFATVVVQRLMSADASADSRDAQSFGAAALLMHLPWTLVVLRNAAFDAPWLVAIVALTVLTTTRLARIDARAGLVAAPYAAWTIAALAAQAADSAR